MSRPAARAHRLGQPRRARVEAGSRDGRPCVVDGRVVDVVRESWLVEDRWWNGSPIRRRYWEIVTTCGRDVVVFHDLRGGEWFAQRG
ncbi:MAG: hypothetical protein ACJ76L_10245 [Conexibacter sp.]